MTPLEQVQEKILKLTSMLEEQLPGFPTVLRDIHKQLKADEELVTLLAPEELNAIVEGMKAQTKVTIVETAKSKTRTKAMSKVTVADL